MAWSFLRKEVNILLAIPSLSPSECYPFWKVVVQGLNQLVYAEGQAQGSEGGSCYDQRVTVMNRKDK